MKIQVPMITFKQCIRLNTVPPNNMSNQVVGP